MGQLEGKTAVITGGNQGMGKATAQAFIREGASVLIYGRNIKTLGDTKRELGERLFICQGDAGDLSDLDRLAAVAQRELKTVDIVFANAGTGHGTAAPVADITDAFYDDALRVNVKGKFFTVSKLLPLMKPGGSVILTGGIGGRQHFPQLVMLCMAQAAVAALARGLAVELAPMGVRVNSICPGFIDGPAYDDVDMQALDQQFINRVPMKRLGTGDEIAELAVFLGSDGSSYVTGAELVVDGGATLPI